jgi:hypothetical protein
VLTTFEVNEEEMSLGVATSQALIEARKLIVDYVRVEGSEIEGPARRS